MLTEIANVSGNIFATPLFSEDEARFFDGLRDSLPRGWTVELEPDAEMAWVAFVLYADAPRSRPLFTICCWSDRVSLFVQWINGFASSAIAFTELQPIMDLILNRIFVSAESCLATVPAENWTKTQH